MFDTLKNLGAGYRTYIVAGLILILVVVEKLLGIDVPGFDPGNDWLAFVLNALGLGTLRAALK